MVGTPTLSVSVGVAMALAAGLLRGFSGFGSALVLAPTLSALYGPAVGVPAAVLLELAFAIPFVFNAARLADWRGILLLGAAATVTIPIGGWLLIVVDPRVIRWILSAVVLGASLVLVGGFRYHRAPDSAGTAAVGALSGLLNGAGGLSGPPVVFFYLAGHQSVARTRASLIVFFAWIDSITLLMFAANGVLTTRTAVIALPLVVPFLVAATTGAVIMSRTGGTYYRHVAVAALAVVAVGSAPW